jgi:hypothetical protein
MRCKWKANRDTTTGKAHTSDGMRYTVGAVISWCLPLLPHICIHTGVKQNFARKHRIPIDTITFNYRCLPEGGDYSKVGWVGRADRIWVIAVHEWCFHIEFARKAAFQVP